MKSIETRRTPRHTDLSIPEADTSPFKPLTPDTTRCGLMKKADIFTLIPLKLHQTETTLLSKVTLTQKVELFTGNTLRRLKVITGTNFGILFTSMLLHPSRKDSQMNGECGLTDHSISFLNSEKTDSWISSQTESSSRPEMVENLNSSDST